MLGCIRRWSAMRRRRAYIITGCSPASGRAAVDRTGAGSLYSSPPFTPSGGGGGGRASESRRAFALSARRGLLSDSGTNLDDGRRQYRRRIIAIYIIPRPRYARGHAREFRRMPQLHEFIHGDIAVYARCYIIEDYL